MLFVQDPSQMCSTPSTDTAFHSFKAEFPHVSLSFTRSFVVANIIAVSWNGGEVNEQTNERASEWMNGRMLEKWKTSAFRLTRMRYGTINMSQGIWFNSSTSNERSSGRTSKQRQNPARHCCLFSGKLKSWNVSNSGEFQTLSPNRAEPIETEMCDGVANWIWNKMLKKNLNSFGELPFVLLCLEQYQWFWHYYSFLKTSNWWVYFIRFTDKR